MLRSFLVARCFKPVEDGISLFANLPGDLHMAKAIGNLLSGFSRLLNGFGQVARMKGGWQCRWDQFSQVSGRSKSLNTFDVQKSLILDLKVVFPMPAATTMSGEAKFFHFN